ncbi:hypothetical protein [Methylocystis bryophila]|uniref:Uncharacterized protein n=1 Tax=Methylocystis bryophila TaxID=655015 RepID=A0A1W6MW75_9HYPH|nr:hypothetical protein [Methylocystis bryophila]ARN81834.1 hypothetical protein B1812_12925 [Methylocystis bryophila]BDV37907.1 hypothetical protein DSM21852_11600 [Methylocystis bryophila]
MPSSEVTWNDAADMMKRAEARGKSDERRRIRAILCCAEAEDRQRFARHLAFDTTFNAGEARGFLANTPKEEVSRRDRQSLPPFVPNATPTPCPVPVALAAPRPAAAPGAPQAPAPPREPASLQGAKGWEEIISRVNGKNAGVIAPCVRGGRHG